nr:immunoglobulin heavy chain junction region [Macaca mulatta]MOV37958.1 immunoglobulin heavy chain junction region [Macaca mulatta]MOV38794.1 immunoglobulin heavy chain junction region [Macaca mulatta]MOV38812.1 immunoglobulin heavy chain junction region [Macaca mulatta]MOV38837.1 immunoglobulin heavy chain junction region [Macaca mulatta]
CVRGCSRDVCFGDYW